MANVFNNLVTAITVRLDTTLREQIGYLPAVWINGEASQAAFGQTIQYPLNPTLEIVDAQEDCCDVPCADEQNWESSSMVINNNKAVRFCWTGEEDLAISNSYNQSGSAMRDMQMDEAVRILVNAMETSVASTIVNAAHVYNPINGGVLFNQQSDNIKDLANIRKILHRAAAPDNDRHLVMGYDSSANLVNTYNLTRANENASDATLRRGEMLNMLNFGLHESFAADNDVPAGTGTGYLVVGAQTAGDTTIPVDTGTGTILVGDRVTFAGNVDTYTVASYTGGIITLNQPLTGPLADNAAVTLGAGSGLQGAFHRRAIVLATRTPRILGGQDRARNRAYITDPYSGMTFMVSEYDGYRATNFEIAIVWGVKMVKPQLAVYIPG